MQNGIENVTYKVEDEIPVLIDDYTGEERLNYNSNKDMWCLVTEGKDYGSDEKNLAVQKKTYAPAGFEDLIQQSYDGYQKTKEYKYTDFLFDRSIDSLSQYAETLKSKWEVIQVDLINCKPEEFDAKYEAQAEAVIVLKDSDMYLQNQEFWDKQNIVFENETGMLVGPANATWEESK